MGTPVLIMGKSGVGKTVSLRNFNPNEVGIVNVLDKPFPFKENFKKIATDDYADVKQVLLGSKVKTLVIDDAGYLITNQFMRGHAGGQGGNIFDLYNQLGDDFWSLIRYIVSSLSKDKIVYMFMHEDKNDEGDVKPKTIGKMLDDKVCVEGLFTIVLRAIKSDGKYLFKTESNGFDVAKSPIDMFENELIPNDLKEVDKTIREYYNMEEKENEEN